MDAKVEREHNEKLFDQTLAAVDPGLWQIKQALSLVSINPMVVTYFIDKIHEVVSLTSHGQVITTITDDKVAIEAIPRRPKKEFFTTITVKEL